MEEVPEFVQAAEHDGSPYIYPLRCINSEINRLAAGLDIEFFTGGYAHNITAWFNQHFHQDPYWRLYLPVSGEFQLVFDGMKFKVAPGKMTLVPPNVQFAFEPGTPSTHFFLHFFSRELERRFHRQYPLALPVNTAEKRKDIEKILFHDDIKPEDMSFADFAVCKNTMLNLLAPFVDKMLNEQFGTNVSGTFFKVITAIENMLPGEVDISKLTKISGMSRAGFSASFRKTFGMGPRKYSIMRRMAYAKSLLLQSNMTAKEIAAKSGYENEYYFYRVFRKIVKMTPLEYRKKGHID